MPLGAFLSGGIDSSLVVSYMSELLPQVTTFSIDFPVKAFSEGPYARRVAEIYGTRHEEFVVEPNIVPTIAETVRSAGEPFADSSAIPTYFVEGDAAARDRRPFGRRRRRGLRGVPPISASGNLRSAARSRSNRRARAPYPAPRLSTVDSLS